MYVWFDALGNYITALDYADDEPLYERYWGDIPTARPRASARGSCASTPSTGRRCCSRRGCRCRPTFFVYCSRPPMVAGFKLLGNAIIRVALAESCHGTDVLRYYLPPTPAAMAIFRWSASCARLQCDSKPTNSGNLLSRTVAVSRYYGGAVPTSGAAGRSRAAASRSRRTAVFAH